MALHRTLFGAIFLAAGLTIQVPNLTVWFETGGIRRSQLNFVQRGVKLKDYNKLDI